MTIKHLYPDSRPTLDLNFARDKVLDPRITYSRSSSGTYVNSAGVITNASTNVARFDHSPSTLESLGLLVEEARTNVLQYGEYLDNSYWTRSNCNVTPNIGKTPDGKYTVNRLTANSTGSAYLYYDYTPTTSGYFTVSCYFSSSGTNKYPVISIHRYNSHSAGAKFDLVNGTVLVVNSGDSTGSSNPRSASASITYVGNGVYRCTMSWNRLAINTFISISLGDSSTTDVFGDRLFNPASQISVAAGQYLDAWGFSMEAGAFPTSYIPTPATFTSRASTATYYDSAGVIQTANTNVARSNAYFPDSNGVMQPAGLLLEAAGTNLLNGSQTFATSGGTQNNWVDTNITRDGTLRTSPDNTANALRVTASAADATIISSAAIGSSAQRTFSIFLRRVTGTENIQYTLDNGTSWTTQAITTSWKRYIFPATTADQQVGIRITTSGDAIELWGAQLETYPYATSYIPTTTASVTRSADVSSSSTVTRSADVANMTGANFSSWYNQSQGTAFIGGRTKQSTNSNAGWASFFQASSYTTNRISIRVNNTNVTSNSIQVAGFAQASPGFDSPANIALAYRENDFALDASYQTLQTDTSGSVPSFIDRLELGNIESANIWINGTISRFTYYPTRLSNTILQTLTSS